MSLVRYTGALSALPDDARRALLERSFTTAPGVVAQVQTLIAQVRAEGDAALRRFAAQYDGATLTTLEVPRAELTRALSTLAPPVLRGLERAKRNLERVARAARPRRLSWRSSRGSSSAAAPTPSPASASMRPEAGPRTPRAC